MACTAVHAELTTSCAAASPGASLELIALWNRARGDGRWRRSAVAAADGTRAQHGCRVVGSLLMAVVQRTRVPRTQAQLLAGRPAAVPSRNAPRRCGCRRWRLEGGRRLGRRRRRRERGRRTRRGRRRLRGRVWQRPRDVVPEAAASHHVACRRVPGAAAHTHATIAGPAASRVAPAAAMRCCSHTAAAHG
jgi:hypothetical protein